jgi:hypothetical protein
MTFCYILNGVYKNIDAGKISKGSRLPEKPAYPQNPSFLERLFSSRSTKSAQVVEKSLKGVHNAPKSQLQPPNLFNNDPSAGSPTETLLRLLLPLNDQV